MHPRRAALPAPAANQPPVVAAGISYAVQQGSGPLVVPKPGLLAFAVDPEGDDMFVDYTDYDLDWEDGMPPPGFGDFEANPDGSFQYIPVVNFTGLDNHTFRVRDKSNTVVASVLFNVTAGAVGCMHLGGGAGCGGCGAGGGGLEACPQGRHLRVQLESPGVWQPRRFDTLADPQPRQWPHWRPVQEDTPSIPPA
jgi:hypothetical protein